MSVLLRKLFLAGVGVDGVGEQGGKALDGVS